VSGISFSGLLDPSCSIFVSILELFYRNRSSYGLIVCFLIFSCDHRGTAFHPFVNLRNVDTNWARVFRVPSSHLWSSHFRLHFGTFLQKTMTARQNLLDWLVLVYGKLALNKEIVIGVKDTQVSVFILFTILLIQ
jgi:hypothetical protein